MRAFKVVRAALALAVLSGMAFPAFAEAGSVEWEAVKCSDAAYSGRPAFLCSTRVDIGGSGKRAIFTFRVWSNPRISAHLSMFVVDEGSEFKEEPKGPFILRVDGREVQKSDPGSLFKLSALYVGVSAEMVLSEAALNEIAKGKTLTVEHPDADGKPKVHQLTLPPEIGSLAAYTRKRYSEYYGKKAANAKTAQPVDVAELMELWGPLGEAADRSRFWVYKRDIRTGMIEFDWITHGMELAVRVAQCGFKGECQEHAWTVRPNFDAVIDDAPARTLDWYNEAGKPVFRYAGFSEGGGDGIALEMTTFDIDAVLEKDMQRVINVMPKYFRVPTDPCCIIVNIDRFSPASPAEAKNLMEQYLAELERERLEKERADEAARRLAELSQPQYKLDENGMIDRGPEPEHDSSPSFFTALANAAQQVLRERSAAPVPQVLPRPVPQGGSVSARQDPPPAASGARPQVVAQGGSVSARQDPPPAAGGARPQVVAQARNAAGSSTRSQTVSQATVSTQAQQQGATPVPEQTRKPALYPLHFILRHPLEPGMKARSNPSCFSNILTVPGPDEWPNGWNAIKNANAIVTPYFDEFVKKCAARLDGERHVALGRSGPKVIWNYHHEREVHEFFETLKGRNSSSDDVFVEMRVR